MARNFSNLGRVLLRAPQLALIGLVLLYRWVLSPLKYAIFGPGAKCRFEPSCSGYALEALRRHGFFYGSWLALRRLLRCHPWGACGCDPVPPVREKIRVDAVKSFGSAFNAHGAPGITAAAGQASRPT